MFVSSVSFLPRIVLGYLKNLAGAFPTPDLGSSKNQYPFTGSYHALAFISSYFLNSSSILKSAHSGISETSTSSIWLPHGFLGKNFLSKSSSDPSFLLSTYLCSSYLTNFNFWTILLIYSLEYPPSISLKYLSTSTLASNISFIL